MLVGTAAVCGAQEIGLFRLTGMEGHASARYVGDEFATQQLEVRSRQELSDLRETVFLMTHSYFYHPNFMTLDLGAGPIFQRGRSSADSGETSSGRTLYDLIARASFLRDKPYRGSVFYEHLNPTLNVAPGSVVTQENTRYGLDFSLLAPAPVDMGVSRFRAKGSGVDRIVDSVTDQFSLRTSRPIPGFGLTQFRYEFTGQDSMNGSPSLPIQRTRIDRQNYQLDTHLRFGERDKYDLFNLVSFDTQAYDMSHGTMPDRRSGRFLLDFIGRESERLNIFATYGFNSTDQEITSVTSNAASAGLGYAPLKDLLLRQTVRAEDNAGTQLDSRFLGTDSSAQYKRQLGPGVLSGSYSLRYGRRDQRASMPQVNIIGEMLMMAGTTVIPLGQQRVAAGSIVVSNSTRNQVFIEGVDYALSALGLQTRVQRLVGGSILDGQEVLVDYVFDAGGTYASNLKDQTFNVDWAIGSYFGVYFRYLDSAPKLTSGLPTTPLNVVRSTLYGARLDLPLRLPFELAFGGLYQREDVRETIAPYRRRQYEVYAQSEPFFGRGTIRAAARRVDQDFETSLQDVRLVGYDASVLAQYPLGINVSANATYERDTGSPLARTRMIGTARLQWRYRRMELTMDLTRTRESQDGFQRRRSLVQLFLRRDFW